MLPTSRLLLPGSSRRVLLARPSLMSYADITIMFSRCTTKAPHTVLTTRIEAAQSQSPERETEADSAPAEPTSSTSTAAGPSSHDISVQEDYFGSDELIKELQQNIGSRGEGWFIAQAVVMGLIILSPFKLQGLIDLVGTVALATGLVFLGYALLSLGRNLSPMPRPRSKHTLVTTGMYSYVRHPMYGGLLLAALGLAALSRSETRLALAAVLWWIVEQKTALEEAALVERYPTEYEEYRGRVRKFIPWLY